MVRWLLALLTVLFRSEILLLDNFLFFFPLSTVSVHLSVSVLVPYLIVS